IPAALCADSFSITGIKNARVLPVPVWAVAITSLPSRACGMAAACTGVGVENRAVVSRSFNEEDIDSSEKLCILLSCWQSWREHSADTRAAAAISIASLLFNLR